jgi:hypothetical protein
VPRSRCDGGGLGRAGAPENGTWGCAGPRGAGLGAGACGGACWREPGAGAGGTGVVGAPSAGGAPLLAAAGAAGASAAGCTAGGSGAGGLRAAPGLGTAGAPCPSGVVDGAAAAGRLSAFLAGAGACLGACAVNASLSLRTTGASIVEDADRTNSPISWSLAITALLSTPNSFASSYTRTFATALLLLGPAHPDPRGRPGRVLRPASDSAVHRRMLIGRSSRSDPAPSALVPLSCRPECCPGRPANLAPRTAAPDNPRARRC